LFNLVNLREYGFTLRVRLDLNFLCPPNLLFVRVNEADFFLLIGLLQAAGEAITLPFLGPLLQRNFLVVVPLPRFQAVDTPSKISATIIFLPY